MIDDVAHCEPWRSWNRIEPRPRQTDFTQALQAQVHDALWMLTRQWQFGEFQGEDTGSAIMAKMDLEIARISQYQNPGCPAEAYADQVPLEARVERRPFAFDFRTCVQAGQQWLKFLEYYGQQYNQTNVHSATPGQPYQPQSYTQQFLQCFAMPVPEINLSDPATIAERAAIISARPAHQFLKAAVSRGMDGVRLYQLTSSTPTQNAWPAEILNSVAKDHLDWINQAGTAFHAWFNQLYFMAADPKDQAWNPQALEYQFACAVSESDGTKTVLQADEYYQGSLDWYACDVDPNRTTLETGGISIPDRPVENRILSVIPSESRFGGMPAYRWWEFEDGCVDLGDIQADTTDLAKILLAEFALMYSNDWFLVPVKVPVGSLSEVKGLVVTDVFGQRTWVGPAGDLAADDWSGWSLFHLTVEPQTGQFEGSVDTRLFLPPTVVKLQESEPMEEVKFIRDETTNMVWALETRVSDWLGQSQDGHDASRQTRTLIENLDLPGQVSGAVPATATLSYRFSNTVPENWIPFIPVQMPNDARSIQLQRGSMPRTLFQPVQPVRPRTLILRTGLNPDQSQTKAYYIHAEEVTRAGATVASSFQRARWFNGSAFTWYGERKNLGRGEGGSGLKFDFIEPIKK